MQGHVYLEGKTSFESNLPRSLKLELFIDDKSTMAEVEKYRTYAPRPFVRVPLPDNSKKVTIRISKRTGREITNVGDFTHYEKDKRG